MYGYILCPKADHVGPDRMGTGAVSLGHGSGGGRGRNCGFEENLALEVLVTQQILWCSGKKKKKKRKKMTYKDLNCVKAQPPTHPDIYTSDSHTFILLSVSIFMHIY